MAKLKNTSYKLTLPKGTNPIVGRGLILVALAIVVAISPGLVPKAAADSLTFNSVADTQVSAQAPNGVYGSDVKMTTCGAGTPVCSTDNADEKQSLVKFNVAGVTTEVLNAKLRFHVDNKPVPQMQIKQTTTTTWEETTATWSNAANLPTTAAIYTNTAGTELGWYEVDVTGAVTADGTYSFMFTNANAAPVRIATKESANAPQLILTAADEPVPPVLADLTFISAGDAQIATAPPHVPDGTHVKMTACGTGAPVCSVDSVDEKRGLVKFNVTGADTVVSAKLRFHVDNKPVPAFTIKQTTTTDWDETTATWNNANNLPTTSATYTSPAGAEAGWFEADVTGAVTGDGTYSFMFINTDGIASRIATKESVNKPQLIVTVETTAPPVETMNTYFGTTHVHTGAFNTHGGDTSTPANIFAAAKASGFDFTMLTEHSGPTGPTDPVAYYADAQAQAEAYSDDGDFIGFAGYEYSENDGDGDTDNGHMTGWGTQEFVNAAAPGIGFGAFYDILDTNKNVPRPVLAGFNHPIATGHAASASNLLTPERRDFVVMSETSNHVAYNEIEETKFYQGFVAELDRGWRVAPTCGLDSHGVMGLQSVESATKKPCRTGVLAPSLTKDSLINAFMQRRIYSTRDVNMQLSYKVNNEWMGSQIGTPTVANFDITVSDPSTADVNDKIKKIEIIGNGGVVLASQTFDAHDVTWQPTVAVDANTYMFVRVYNDERTAHTTVGAPVWFE